MLPLRAGDEVLGALVLVAAHPHRHFDETDREFGGALAERIADALRNERLLRYRGEIAHVLSAGLRPDPAPVLPGCELRAVYRPAGADIEAGGDFYEVVDAPSGSIVVIGDIAGKGAQAAALSAVARVTLRTAGRLTGDPRAALDELNHALRRRGGMSLCTAAAVALPTELPGEAEVVLAGHPPPLLVRGGTVSEVGIAAPMLGAVEVVDWHPARVELAPGDVLVLFTDGVLDAVLPNGERFGEQRLRRMAESTGDDVEALTAALDAELADLSLRDDVALLAIRCPGAPQLLARGSLEDESEWLLELELAAARSHRASAPGARDGGRRARFRAGLQHAVLIVSELVTNAIRHGGAPGRGRHGPVARRAPRRRRADRGDRPRPRLRARRPRGRATTAATASACWTGSRRAGASAGPRR